jgi:iron complex transport system ATP-binding protein
VRIGEPIACNSRSRTGILIAPTLEHRVLILEFSAFMSVYLANQLAVSVRDRQILYNLTFRINPGEWIGVLGPNGSGKSTLLRTLSGAMDYSNELAFQGKPVHKWVTGERARELAFVRQSHSLSFDFKVIELVLLGRTPYKSLFASFRQADVDRARRALSDVDLSGFEDRTVSSLSGGETQRVFLAQAMVQDPSVLLLDEPTNHLDVHHQFGFLNRVREFVLDGNTVIGAFHDIEMAARYCSRLFILSHGRLIADGTPAEVITKDLIENIFDIQADVTTREDGTLNIRYMNTFESIT